MPGKWYCNNLQSKNTMDDEQSKFITEARRYQKQREQGYREQALKMFPWICARCGREFSGRRLQQLTVHHKDHDHDHNPADGSNWELLCIYCHEQEHTKYLEENKPDGGGTAADSKNPSSTFKPFANLGSLINPEKE